MSISPFLRICLIMLYLLLLTGKARTQSAKLPPGIIEFRDSTVHDIFLDLKNAHIGILRYRRSGQTEFQRASLDRVTSVQVYPGVSGRLKQTLVVKSQPIDAEVKIILMEAHQIGRYSLLSEVNKSDRYFLEDPSGAFTEIPTAIAQRKKLYDQLLKQRKLTHHNRKTYQYNLASLRRFTAYLNGTDQQRFPGVYFKGKVEYLRKNWNLYKKGNTFNLPIILASDEWVYARIIQGNPSNIMALSAVFETPFYHNYHLTFIQELGLRKERTSVYQVDATTISDLKLDASFLTGELAVKYSDRNGKHFPFVRVGIGSSFRLAENNRLTESLRSSSGLFTTTSNDQFVSAVTLHPGLRFGTEFYIKGPTLLTAGLVYTREMMLFRPISSSSNAFGVYAEINFY